MSKIRNIIIFTIIAAAFILIYIFFIKQSPPQDNLISSSDTLLPSVNGLGVDATIPSETSLVAKDFLTLLLNVKNIKLDNAIFSDPSFNSLRDSSIVLIPDGTEGRPNPFAQFGVEATTPLNTITEIKP
ncbi:MAG: hypothetical protein WC884_02000 [Candidatus Paceibacterota bacterium]